MVITRKYKQDRRLGMNTWGRRKSPFNSRPNVPGSNPNGRIPMVSAYGETLKQKQACKRVLCCFKESKFKRIVQKAKKSRNVVQELISLCGLRLISVIFRATWAATPFAAKQLLNHGHILVNGKKVTTGEQLLKINDVVKIKCFNNVHVAKSVNSKERPVAGFLEVSDDVCKVIGYPSVEEPDFKKLNLAAAIESYR